MKSLKTIAFLAITTWPPLLAQSDAGKLVVNVNPPISRNESAQNSTPVKLFLDAHELPITRVERLPNTPLHVVFVLDNGGHQQGLMSLARDYVVKLATAVHNSQPTFTVVSAAKDPEILAQTGDPSALQSELAHADTPLNSPQEESADLNAGIALAANLLSDAPGVRDIVILSDDDDDINGKGMQSVKTQLATAHIRCFSILLAQHDFFGTKARTAWGVRLNSLANFSGGAQYNTYWQSRQSDEVVLRTVAARVSSGNLVSFSIPANLNVRPGVYYLKVQLGDGKSMIRSSPFVLLR